jgi:exosortase/archaeosortase family protein
MQSGFQKYVLLFLGIFACCYAGVYGFIGITTPGKWYVSWLDEHMNFVRGYRYLMFAMSQGILALFGYATYLENSFTLRIVHANAVKMVWSCMGFGLLSFWIAFVTANAGKLWFKLRWVCIGIGLITLINVARIVLILVAVNRKWSFFFAVNHHDLFNWVMYAVLLILVLWYRRKFLNY